MTPRRRSAKSSSCHPTPQGDLLALRWLLDPFAEVAPAVPDETNPKSPTPLDHWNGRPNRSKRLARIAAEEEKEKRRLARVAAVLEKKIVNAHLSLGLEIIPIVHRNYDGWTIRWSLPARRPTRDHEFESDFL